MLSSKDAVVLFKRLGVDWRADDDLFCELEEFVCKLYGERKKDVIEVRYHVFTARCRVDDALPPNNDSFRLHIARASYQTAVYRRCLEAQIHAPGPVGFGWQMDGLDLVC